MFLAVTIFASMINIIKPIRRQTPVKIWNAIINGLIIGMLAFIGHTILFDLWYMPETNEWLEGIVDDKYITLNVVLAFFISVTILIGKSIGFIFSNDLCD